MTPDRLSLNQKTTDSWSLHQAVDGCARAGLRSIGLWREPVREAGLATAARLVADAGLRVSSLCRGGFLTTDDPVAARGAIEDNVRAIEEAAELGAACLVLVVGGLPDGSRDLPGARDRVARALDALVPRAAEHRVRLALEPMNPIYCADRGVLSTLSQALDLAERYPADRVGVVVDTFHVWWDPEVLPQIARAGTRIFGFQVCDWITPLPADTLLARGMMGDGHIDFRALRAAVDAAGYDGDIEVEIFNADIWAADPDAVVETMKRRYVEHVVGR
ncbi:sugar phosphate isomerase/epimerase family protein [Amycolatopsis sp. H20-H5]|uniref:sugar phosphate isomerase/epimerase family protein n=1 Tax=Amycolatopsis sp. H20-H5 TaxID=3046309 RepID=UPI002DB807D2|nr:sugar phosphate isomerase/epimerase family protein [Amycolatopsis sp. H20-H5]MEC3977552.1 sugar phosphate isomerase/epimerase family protein [Amycolatopsis sp. H20-H5]